MLKYADDQAPGDALCRCEAAITGAPAYDQQDEEFTVKKFALCIALAAGFAGTAQAALVELERAATSAAPVAGVASRADLMVTPGAVAPGQMSELPEPEVFAMMLLGVALIGWRVSRHSDEKFE